MRASSFGSNWGGLALGSYSTLVVDPPWPQQGGGSLMGREKWLDAGGASLPLPYSTMTLEEIGTLPVADLAAKNSHLFLWSTSGFLPHAFEVAAKWGFTYSTMLVWCKKPMGGGLGGAFGISTEFILHCRRGKPAWNRTIGTWWQWKRPYNAAGKPMHSAKPPEFYELVRAVTPGPYVELFAADRVKAGMFGEMSCESIQFR